MSTVGGHLQVPPPAGYITIPVGRRRAGVSIFCVPPLINAFSGRQGPHLISGTAIQVPPLRCPSQSFQVPALSYSLAAPDSVALPSDRLASSRLPLSSFSFPTSHLLSIVGPGFPFRLSTTAVICLPAGLSFILSCLILFGLPSTHFTTTNRRSPSVILLHYSAFQSTVWTIALQRQVFTVTHSHTHSFIGYTSARWTLFCGIVIVANVIYGCFVPDRIFRLALVSATHHRNDDWLAITPTIYYHRRRPAKSCTQYIQQINVYDTLIPDNQHLA